MKKLFLTICLTAMLSTPAIAACEGGTEASGFCISRIQLNWWSAATWCKANGMHLATMYEACPDWDGTSGNGYPCPISGSSIGSDEHAWTATVSGEGYAYFVNPVSGYVSTLSRSYPGAYALCAN